MALGTSTYQDTQDPMAMPAAHAASEAEENLPLAIVAGGAAALISAAVWAGITVASGYQIGWMAVGVGFLVGLAVRLSGHGKSTVFGVVGGGLALLGCMLGNLLAGCGFVAAQEGVSFVAALPLLFSPAAVVAIMTAMFSPMDLLFYGIAVYEGYRLSIDADDA